MSGNSASPPLTSSKYWRGGRGLWQSMPPEREQHLAAALRGRHRPCSFRDLRERLGFGRAHRASAADAGRLRPAGATTRVSASRLGHADAPAARVPAQHAVAQRRRPRRRAAGQEIRTSSRPRRSRGTPTPAREEVLRCPSRRPRRGSRRRSNPSPPTTTIENTCRPRVGSKFDASSARCWRTNSAPAMPARKPEMRERDHERAARAIAYASAARSLSRTPISTRPMRLSRRPRIISRREREHDEDET